MEFSLVHELSSVVDTEGSVYAARVMGAPAEDGPWEGVIEFRSPGGRLLRTPVETRQPNLADLVYWSTGVTPVYVEGALVRAEELEVELRLRPLRDAGRTGKTPCYARPSRVRRAVPHKPRARASSARRT